MNSAPTVVDTCRVRVVSVQDVGKGVPVQQLPQVEAVTEDNVGRHTEMTGRGKNRFAIRELFADVQCTGAILDFLRTTKVGKRVGPRELPPEPTGGREEGDIRSPASRSFVVFLSFCLFLPCHHQRVFLLLSLSLSFSLSFFLFLFSGDRPGGGTGSRREPLADCSTAQRTANMKGLYIIS